jgi:hypothetical protein
MRCECHSWKFSQAIVVSGQIKVAAMLTSPLQEEQFFFSWPNSAYFSLVLMLQ